MTACLNLHDQMGDLSRLFLGRPVTALHDTGHAKNGMLLVVGINVVGV